MPLFGPKEPLDLRIESVWAKPQHHKQLKEMESPLRKSQDTILAEVDPEANPLIMVAVGWRYSGADGVFALTGRNALHVKKSSVATRLEVSDIAQVEVGQSDQGEHVTIWTRTALTEFLPDDLERWKYGMFLTFPTPGIATAVADNVKSLSPLLSGPTREESS
jgi:hypothetical protein